MAASTSTCCECSYRFRYDAAFFAERNLAPPKRCARCRAERLTSRRPLAGRITSTGSRFSIVRCDAGQEFFAPGPLGLALGARVVFHGDPDEVPGAGRRLPTAHDVQADTA